jgi:hypothetical protein
MTTRPDGIRRALAVARPWRRRVLHLVGVWLGVVVMALLLGLQPDVAHLGAILLAGAMAVWYLLDHTEANRVAVWPLRDSERADRRGGDYRASSLATRLEAADRRGEGRPELTRRLHAQLSTIILERLFAKHGITIEEEPRWAQGVMPPELWEFVTGLPDPALYSPAHLDQILRRIEQW